MQGNPQAMLTALQHLDRSIRSQAALNLGKSGDETALEPLLQALRTEPELLVREDITWALVRLGDVALSSLMALLHDDDPAMRHHVAHVLGKIKNVRAVEGLIRTLQDTDVTVVLKAAFGLAQIGDDRAILPLVALLGTEHRELQTMLINVLERFEDAAVPPLLEALQHERWQVREQAADVLGAIQDKATIPALTEALKDEHWQVRFAAVTALGYLGGARVIHVLLPLQDNDPEPRVRELIPLIMAKMKAKGGKKLS